MTEPHHTATDRPLRAPSRVPGVVALCGLGLLGILGYVLTTMVPRQRAAGMVGWRDRLSALAEDRGSAIDDVIRHVSADAAVLSFHPVKHVTTGEGGAVVLRDPQHQRRAQRLRHHGIERDPARLSVPSPGLNR